MLMRPSFVRYACQRLVTTSTCRADDKAHVTSPGPERLQTER